MSIDTKNGDGVTPEHPDYLLAALSALKAGFIPIPIRPGTKRTALKWDRWSQHISYRNIRRYWNKNPDHEVGMLLNDAIFVCDADTPEGVAALHDLEASLGLTPNLIVGTARGEHHYFRRAKGTKAKSYAPEKSDTPQRFDTKTGRAIAVIPPSQGKHYVRNEIVTVVDLVEINQAQIDAINLHNGRAVVTDKPERIKPLLFPPPTDLDPLVRISELQSLLQHLDPDMGYTGWLSVIMAIFHTTLGSDEGLALADEWSRQGTKYQGFDEIEAKWLSLDIECPNPVTIASLYRLVKDTLGQEKYREIQFTLGPQWDLSRGDTTTPPVATLPAAVPTAEEADPRSSHPLAQFSLYGMSGQLKAEAFNHRLILGKIAIQGQLTVIYAKPNTGKTLIIIDLIVEAIKRGNIDPRHLFFINADDGYSGITTKAAIADEFGFHMLVPGHKNFKVKDFLDLLQQVADTNHAPETIIILDTLKKFTDLMNKSEASKFGIAIRQFTARGGTVIALAHTNKNRDTSGKLVAGGTSDIQDDADCVYLIDVLADRDDIRTVEFSNTKNRGDVAKKVIFQYSTADRQGYQQLMDSVTEIDPVVQDQLKMDLEMELSGDSTLIALVRGFIAQGINTKTSLTDELAKLGGVSKSRARKLIEEHTGTDPIKHRWNFTVGAHGVKTYSILSVTSPDPAPAPDSNPAPAPEPPETGTEEEK